MPSQIGNMTELHNRHTINDFFLTEKLKIQIHQSLSKELCTPKQIAQVIGVIPTMYFAVDPLVHLFTRHLYYVIGQHVIGYYQINISTSVIDEVRFWLSNIYHWNGCTFKPTPTTTQIVFTDVCDTGYGGFALLRLQKLICSDTFSQHESQQSSTYRELLAVKLVLQSYGVTLRDQSIQINIHNYAAIPILLVSNG